MDFSEFAVPIQNESPYASTYFVQNAFGNSQINGPLEPNAGTYVFRNLNGGLLDIDQDLATINTNYGIQTQGRLFTRISRFLDFHLLPFAGAYGLKIETGTYCNLQSRFDVDGTAAQELLANANLAIINHGIIEMPFSVNMNFNNLYAGIYLKSGSQLNDLGNTWIYTNITVPVIYENGAQFYSLNSFDTTNIVFIGSEKYVNGSTEFLENLFRMLR